MHKVKLAPNGQCVVIAQLSRASYLDGVSSHWAPKVAWCVVWCCLLALPTAHIFMQIDLARRQICDVGGEHALNPVGPQHLHERFRMRLGVALDWHIEARPQDAVLRRRLDIRKLRGKDPTH